MVDGKKFFDQLIENDIKTYDKFRRIAVGQGDGYKTNCFLITLISKKIIS